MNELFCPKIFVVTHYVLSLARANLVGCIRLLKAFIANGLQYVVVCPGSRSGPLAMAAAGLAESSPLNLITSIDERSASFLALGSSTANGKATVVITTSGTAVANLLPAAIEADRSSQPLIFLTADRPRRLKDCGSNQTVNQEDFLKSVCRWVEHGPEEGLHLSSKKFIESIANRVWIKAHDFAGPVHFNLSFEEPLHASLLDQKDVWQSNEFNSFDRNNNSSKLITINNHVFVNQTAKLNPYKSGVVVAGPWRGLSKDLKKFNNALRYWQSITGWPVFADPLSGVDINQPGLINNWELLINSDFFKRHDEKELTLLRLGPLPSSKILEKWISKLKSKQVLISEGDGRCLDPLGLSVQWNYGLCSWVDNFSDSFSDEVQKENNKSTVLLNELIKADSFAESWLGERLKLTGLITEPLLAHYLPKIIPLHIPVMLSASSPVRDWITFAGRESFSKRCFGFRGASGIDGTLSLGMGLSLALGPVFLITGDLALLHDSNGWLFAKPLKVPLIVLVIDNGGGGLFDQLDIEEFFKGNFENLFKMPQYVDPFLLASSHDIPSRQISSFDDLGHAIEWAISLNQSVLLRVCTNSFQDKKLRNDLKLEFKEHLNKIISNNPIDSC